MRGLLQFLVVILTGFIGAPIHCSAHGGGLDAQGCHQNRKTGDYHCHSLSVGNGSERSAAEESELVGLSSLCSQPITLVPPVGRAFKNCTEARNAGAAPVNRGDPGYAPHLDRDNDGVGCEPTGWD